MRYNRRHVRPADYRPTGATRDAPTLAEIETIAHDAFARLPEKFRTLCEGLVIHVDDFATDEVLDDCGSRTQLDLIGLFQGVGLPFRSESTSATCRTWSGSTASRS